MSKRIEAVWEFLKAARNLVKNKNATKDQIIAFAKQQFGEIDDFFKLQIDNLFRKPKVISPVEQAYKKELARLEGALGSLDAKQPGFKQAADELIEKITKLQEDYKAGKFVPEGQADVVPIKADEAKDIKKVIDEKKGDDFIDFVRKSGDEEGANKIKKEVDRLNTKIDEAEVSGTAEEIVKKRTNDMVTGELDSGTGIESLATSMNKLKKKIDKLKKTSQEIIPGDIMKEIMKGQKVMAENYKTGNIRTAVRWFMRSEADAGRLKISADDLDSLKVYGQTTESDPINIFRRYYGEGALESVDEIGDVFRQGKSFKHYEQLLRENIDSKILTPKTKGLGKYDEGVLSPEQENELKRQLLKEQDQKKMLEEWKPDREPNADGGLIDILKL